MIALAFRIPAEPGWRAVTLTVHEAPIEGADAKPVTKTEILGRVVPIAFWGVRGFEVPHGRCGGHALLGSTTPAMVVGEPTFGFGGGVPLLPLNAEGAPILAHRIVEPSDATDDALLDQAEAWLTDKVAKGDAEKKIRVRIVR